MSNSSTINIDIKVDDDGSVSTLRKFGNEVDKTGKTGSLAFGSLVKAASGVTAAVTSVTAAAGALVITSAAEAREIENLARLANLSSSEFRQYAFATESIGISAEKFADINKDVQDKLGDFIATGGGEFLDFFQKVAPKVGLTAQELQKLSGPDVLVAVKQAMDDANVSAAEQTFYMEAIADDASLLIPLLKNGGQALKDQAARARELGISLSEVDSKNLVAAGGATSELTSAFSGLKNNIAAEFAPIFTDVMNGATDLIIDFKDEARAAAGTFVNIAESFKGWKAVFGGNLGFFDFATMNAKEFDAWLLKNQANTKTLGQTIAETERIHREEVERTNLILNEQKRILGEISAENEKKSAAQLEMYQETGMGADQYFSKEATELVQKAERWKKAGADTYAIEQWLYEQLGKLSDEAWAKGESAAGQSMDTIQGMGLAVFDVFDNVNSEVSSILNEMGIKVDELNGKEFTLRARFDGSDVISGVDEVIQKISEMKAAAAAASASVQEQRSPASASGGSGAAASSAPAAETADEAALGNYAGGPTIVNNFNQQISRSDVTSIVSEQARQEARK
jgi:ribosomal protein L12E/L44/L45/RPP1/RPP2